MKLSYKILSVFGIDIELHLFFILFILAFVIISPPLAFLLILIFFFVTLHELTHSIVAIRNKIKVRRIILLPIGGMAMVETTDIKPLTEIKMSLAGPLLNITIVYICLVIAYLFSLPLGSWLTQFFDPTGAFALPLPELVLFYSFYGNLILGVFNLLVPAFPLDGGRILRALLALRLEYVRASRIAKNISLVIAGSMFLVSFLFGEIWIMIIAFFIGFGAVAEFDAMVMHKALMKIRTGDVLSKSFLTVKPSDSISSVLAKMLQKRTVDALVRTKTGLRSISLADISRMPRGEWKKRAISIAKPTVHATINTSIEGIVKRMELEQISIIPVFDGKKLIGVVERSNIERMIKIVGMLGDSSSR